VQPTSDTVAAVSTWAKANNIKTTVISPNEEWISFTVPISLANVLFGAQYTTFTHVDSGKQIIRTLSYSLPSNLVGHVMTVTPTTSFVEPNFRGASPEPQLQWSRRRSEAQKRALNPSCNSTITPACLEALYGIPTTPAINKKNKLLVTGYVEQWANDADLKVIDSSCRMDSFGMLIGTLDILDRLPTP
jgi:tripeptidyl-peptidase I